MMCFIELLKRVGLNYNYRLTQLFTLDCVSGTFLGMIGADVEGGGELPRRCGEVRNGSDEVTYDGPEGVIQSDTVSIPAVVPVYS